MTSKIGRPKATQKHANEFLALLAANSYPRETRLAIRAIIHRAPLFVFWVSPSGEVIDAGNAHHDNPPNGDRSVLSDSINKGYLRGRSALIGDMVYVVIYGDDDNNLTRRQRNLLRKAYTGILAKLASVVSPELRLLVADAHFIDETGDDVQVIG